jgi:hypothetical protein
VEQISHGWFLNYQRWPLAWLLPVLATIAGFAGSALLSKLRRHALAFVVLGTGHCRHHCHFWPEHVPFHHALLQSCPTTV